MDPATVAMIIKGLDIAFTLANYYMNREEAIGRKAEMLDQMKRIAETRQAFVAGGLSEVEVDAMLDDLLDTTLADMRAAMARL
jgi:hypothetical protein